MERLQKWKMALNQAANLSGSHFKPGSAFEYEFIKKIVEEVSNRIRRMPLHVADYPVGIESQVLEVMSLLDVGSGYGVHTVGIYGLGGMGKTTLARAVYNFIADQFKSLCFLHNVRESSAKHGFKHLQENLLSKTVGLNIKLVDVSEGISLIKQRLHRKKVLLILDDVDKSEQLRAIIGNSDWFGSGSRVIITTRDKHLLASHGVERKYEIYGLNKKEALELFCWNAFRNDKINPCYENVINQAVAYASGLPLALEIIGSNLFEKNVEEWKSALDQYERIPNKKIQKILEISFYALEEEEKNVFLDIACCFKGYMLAEVEDILRAHHGDCVKYHIGVLNEKSLTKITREGEITLHDLIEDMGKEIVRKESPKEPGKRSRLWSHKDIVEVLEENTGTSEIEMIYLDFPSFEEVEWDGGAFKKMKNLKTLIIRKCHFSKGPKHLPNSLRVLEWWNYPSQHLPSDFYPKKLSIWKLPTSCITTLEFPSSSKKFTNMKVLNFNGCQYLTQIADVSSLPNLERFSFKECENLVAVHHSVGLLDKLQLLDAEGCHRLRSFPPLKLPSLLRLKLAGCLSLTIFPEIIETMENITELDLYGSSITEFPSSCRNLNRLRTLQMSCWLPRRNIVMMPELAKLSVTDPMGRILEIPDEGEEKVSSMLLASNVEFLRLPHCDMSDDFLAICLTWFANLRELSLQGSNFTIIPECIKQCRFLWKLDLDDCKQLQEVEGIPPSLKYLSARECESLSFSSRSLLLNQELHEVGNTEFFCLPSPDTGGIPEWFEHQCKGPSSSISFWFRNNFPDNILLCLGCLHPAYMIMCTVDLIVNGKIFVSYSSPSTGYTQLRMLSEESKCYVDKAVLKNEWNHVKVMMKELISVPDVSIDIGIHVVKEKSSMENIRFTDPYKKRKLNLSLPPLPENDVNSNPSTTYLENDVDTESSLSITHSDVKDREREDSSNFGIQYNDFNSDSLLSGMDFDVDEKAFWRRAES